MSVELHGKDCASVVATGCVVAFVQKIHVLDHYLCALVFDRHLCALVDGETALRGMHVCLFANCDVRHDASCDCIPPVVDLHRAQASLRVDPMSSFCSLYGVLCIE